MKIVIDISEDDFGCIYDRYADGDSPDEKSLTDTVMYAIANGTVLPKGHGTLKDIDKIISDGINKGFCDWYDEMENAPTVIEADRGETMAKDYDVWMEGYSCTGQSKTHEFIGRVKAESFEQACEIAVKNWCSKESFENFYDPENQTFWGCKCYDNEADAAKHFG